MIRSLLALVLFILIVYGITEAIPLLTGPSLSVESPQDGASFPGGMVSISGKASRIALLTLNGTSVLHNQDGSFTLTLTFPHGTSILTFVATDRFGRHVTLTRSIFVPLTPTNP